MELALAYNLTHQQLNSINMSRMYLQVLALSDITAADGEHILPTVLHGIRDTQRTSPFHWPKNPCPPPAFWSQWHLFLQFVCWGKKLYQPLGPWTAPPVQTWTWFQHKSGEVYHIHQEDNKWHIYEICQQYAIEQDRENQCSIVTSSDPFHHTQEIFFQLP